MTISYPCYEAAPLHPQLPGMPAMLHGYNCTDGTLLIQGLAPRNVVTVKDQDGFDGEFDMTALLPKAQVETLLRISQEAIECGGAPVHWTGELHRGGLLFPFTPFATCYADGRIDLTQKRGYRTKQWFLHRDDLQAIYDSRDSRPAWWNEALRQAARG